MRQQRLNEAKRENLNRHLSWNCYEIASVYNLNCRSKFLVIGSDHIK